MIVNPLHSVGVLSSNTRSPGRSSTRDAPVGHGRNRWAKRSNTPSLSGSTPLRSASAYQRATSRSRSSGCWSPTSWFSAGSLRVSNRCQWSASKSALPAIRSRSAWVSWLTWFVTTFQPSTYMARLPQHS